MEDDAKKLFGPFGYSVATVIVIAILTAIYSAWEGWVLSVLWQWFAVPIFQLPQLTVKESIGIMFTLALLTHQFIPSPKEQRASDKWMAMLYPFILGGMALGVGWFVKG